MQYKVGHDIVLFAQGDGHFSGTLTTNRFVNAIQDKLLILYGDLLHAKFKITRTQPICKNKDGTYVEVIEWVIEE